MVCTHGGSGCGASGVGCHGVPPFTIRSRSPGRNPAEKFGTRVVIGTAGGNAGTAAGGGNFGNAGGGNFGNAGVIPFTATLAVAATFSV